VSNSGWDIGSFLTTDDADGTDITGCWSEFSGLGARGSRVRW
jgi:hypothetical protein